VPALDDAPNTPRRDVILIADASPEGQTIAQALRAQGFAVAFSPIERLEARVLDEAPRVLLVDIDEPGARDAIERLRELPDGRDVELVCLGSLSRAHEVGATSASGRAFARPLDIHTIIAQTAALVDPAPLDDDSIVDDRGPDPRPGETLPPGILEDGSGAFPSMFQSAFPGAPEVAEMGASIFPPEEHDAGAPPTLLPTHPMQLSPELMNLLAAAEQRVLAEMPRSVSAPPVAPSEDEGDLVLSDEFLAILEEPLDGDEEAPGTGPELLQTGAIDPGTGPNVLLGITSGSLALSDANPALTNPSPELSLDEPSSSEPISSSTSERPYMPLPGHVSAVESAPLQRSVESRGAFSEGPATAWEPVRPARSDQTKTPVRYIDPPRASLSASARRGLPPPVIESLDDPSPRIDVAPDATTSPGRSPPWSTTLPARTGSLHPGSSNPSPSRIPSGPMTLGNFSPQSGAGATHAQTSPSLIARSAVEPPPSVRLAPPVPPPLAPVASPSAPLGDPAPLGDRRMVLGPGDAARSLARAISSRATGAIALHDGPAVRRVVLQDGDVVTAASGLGDETLIAFLAARGDIERDVVVRLAGKLPPSGRHAGAALIAHGYLGQDALWPVLRAHAEWIIGRAISIEAGTLELESEPPGRLRAEPSVFGGSTGAEVLVDVVRRVTSPALASSRLGGPLARLDAGPRISLLSECALLPDEEALVSKAPGMTVGELVERAGADMTSLLYALVALEVLTALTPARPAALQRAPADDPLDEEAIRMRVRARLALVEDADYFALLGIGRSATSYEIRRAYLELRRSFEPSRLLTAQTADLGPDVRLVLEVLDEAFDILKDAHRRERYRRAIEAGPPA
jgi:hypothetical protein